MLDLSQLFVQSTFSTSHLSRVHAISFIIIWIGDWDFISCTYDCQRFPQSNNSHQLSSSASLLRLNEILPSRRTPIKSPIIIFSPMCVLCWIDSRRRSCTCTRFKAVKPSFFIKRPSWKKNTRNVNPLVYAPLLPSDEALSTLIVDEKHRLQMTWLFWRMTDAGNFKGCVRL